MYNRDIHYSKWYGSIQGNGCWGKIRKMKVHGKEMKKGGNCLKNWGKCLKITSFCVINSKNYIFIF